MRAPHLAPAAAALLLAAVVVGAGYRYARHVERRKIHAVAAAVVPDLAQRRALQVEALRRHDLLLVYGSSEVIYPDPHHASNLFHDYPTGFTIVPVGQKSGCALLCAQHLAALGPALRGRKVVVSFTPSNCFENGITPGPYAGNFSRVSANELAFQTPLSFGVKRALARRMLAYPEPLEQDPLLEFALRQLADGSLVGRALYYAALPLGRLQVGVLRLQEHWGEVSFLNNPELPPDGRPPAARPPAAPDWSALVARGEQRHRGITTTNPFGVTDRIWHKVLREHFHEEAPGAKDAEARRDLDESPEWGDLDNLLRVLHELGAEPLLLATPMKGPYFDRAGVSFAVRQAYYERARAVARAHGVPLIDFAEHDGDRNFLIDLNHLSSKGWVYYAYALDGFFHNRRGPDLVLRPEPVSPGAAAAEEHGAPR